MSIAIHAAGTAEAATALRTTVALRITSTGRKPSGRRRTFARTAGTPSTSRLAPIAATSSPADGDCTSSTMPDAVRATTIAPTTSRRARCPRGQRAPQQRHDERAEDGQGHDGAPAPRSLDQAADQRAEAAHRGCDARKAPERQPADLAGVLRGQDGDAQRRHRGGAGTLQHAGAEQHLEGRRERRDQRADRHQHEPGEQRCADTDQVGDPTVERRGDGQHQDVEADRPGRQPGAHPEVLGQERQCDGGARGAHARQAEEQAEQHRHPSGVVRGVGAAGGRARCRHRRGTTASAPGHSRGSAEQRLAARAGAVPCGA